MKGALMVVGLLLSLTATAEPLIIENGSLRDLADWASAQTGKTVVLGNGVDAQINLNVPDASAVDPWNLLIGAVASSGLSMTETNGLWTITKGPIKAAGLPAPVGQQKPEPLKYPLETAFFTVDPDNLADIERALRSVFSTWHKQEIVRLGRGDVPVFTAQGSRSSSSIVVTAAPSFMADIRLLISQLDRPQQQVEIEAVIFETSNLEFDAIGIDYRNLDPGTGLSIDYGLATGPLAVVGKGLGIGYSKNGSMRALITALDTSDETNVLSTPVIRVVNRQRGRIDVGQEVPFITSEQTNSEGVTVNTIVRKTVGLTLEVTPFIAANGSIRLQLRTTAGSLSSDTTASDVITNNRTLETTVTALDGEMVYLGGLITEEETGSRAGVPGLQDIPLIGGLFMEKKTTGNKRKLAIFIKPTLI